MLPSGLEQVFQSHNQSQELCEITKDYQELASRAEKSLRPFPEGDYGASTRIRANGLIYRQVLLHRSIRLFEGSLSAAVDENAYSMALSIRGHFETTASIGYFHNRLLSMKRGDINPETLDQDLCIQLLGSRHERLPQAPDPKNILSLLEYADKSVNISVIGIDETPKRYEILKSSYEFLCEFCHPNISSNSVAIEIDKSIPEFKFRHGQSMRNEEFNIAGYLLLSAPIFVTLFDQVLDLLPSKDGGAGKARHDY